MAGDLSGYVKIDACFGPTTADGAVTGQYFDMSQYDKALFIVSAGSGLTDSGNVECTVYSAYGATGGGAAAIGVYTTLNGTPTAAGTVTRAKAVYVDNASSWLTAETLQINGITFTMTTLAAYTTATFSTARLIYTVVSGTAAASSIQHLAAYINHAEYGCTGIYASAATTSLMIYGDQNAVTAITSATSNIMIHALRHEAIMECKSADLLANTSHRYVTVAATPSSAIANISAICIRSGSRYIMSNTGGVGDYDYVSS